MSESDFRDSKEWEKLFKEVHKEVDSISLINTIGTAVAPKGQTLEDINEKPILAAAKALETIPIKKVIAHVSSIAATYFSDDKSTQGKVSSQAMEYSLGRKKVDLFLRDKCSIPATILRPGYVFNNIQEKRFLDAGHDYSFEQFAFSFVHPVIGSGKQIQQPVFVEDLIKALFNGIEEEKNCIINAVGPEVLTQEDMFKFFVHLAGMKYKPVHIPLDMAEVIAKHFPKGRLAEYSVALLAHGEEYDVQLSTKEFEELLREPLTSISKVYGNGDGIIFPKSPIYAHVFQIFQCIRENEDARHDFFAIIKKYGFILFINAVKQQFKSNP